MDLFERITQKLESGVRLIRLETPAYYNAKALLIADIYTPNTGRRKGDSFFFLDEEKKPEIPDYVKKVNNIADSLISIGLKLSSVSPSRLEGVCDRNTRKRFDEAEVIFALPDNVESVAKRYNPEKIVLLVDEVNINYSKFPQMVVSSLPISLSKRRKDRNYRFIDEKTTVDSLKVPVLDETTYETLFGKVPEEEKRKTPIWSRDYTDISLIGRTFGKYLGETPLERLEHLLRTPMTDSVPINDRLTVFDLFISEGADYSQKVASKFEFIGSTLEYVKMLAQKLSFVLQCERGWLGGDLSRIHKMSGLNHDLPCKMDTSHVMIRGLKEQYSNEFMQTLDKVAEIGYDEIMNIYLPDLPTVELQRIKAGLELLLSPSNPHGLISLFRTLKYIKEQNPRNSQELLACVGNKNTIHKHLLTYTFVQDVSCWLSLYSGLASYFASHGWNRPKVLSREAGIIEIEDGWNPFLNTPNPIPNSTYLTLDKNIELVEGANKSGKSIYDLQVPIIVAFAQAGLYVPAKSATISVHDRIYARTKRTGSIIDDQSAFHNEVDDTNLFIENSKEKERYSLICLDEWFTSTRPDNGEALLWGLMQDELGAKGYRAIITSHMPDLKDIADHMDNVQISYFPCEITGREVKYPYKKVNGSGSNLQPDYGVKIAEHLGLPKNIVDGARKRLNKK